MQGIVVRVLIGNRQLGSNRKIQGGCIFFMAEFTARLNADGNDC